MRLAICDDDLKEVENLKEQLNAYQHLHEEESFVYKAYSNPVVFLEDWKRNPCDIAMLDIVMPHMSGIQLGSEIKKINPNIQRIRFGCVFASRRKIYLKARYQRRPF